ncbi:MAG: hypothetical protein KC636_30300 [Myxococcales bacterium]|nr:hypothetical protein [Myxococcales bacterium]
MVLAALHLCLAITLGAPRSTPQPPSTTSAARASTTLVVIAPSTSVGAEVDAMEPARVIEAIAAHLGGSDLELRAVPGPPAHASFSAQLAVARELADSLQPRAIVWLDLRAPSHAVIYLLHPADGRLFARRVQIDPDAREASIEAVALIVSASGQALTSGREVLMQEVDPIEQAAAESETPPAEEPVAPPTSTPTPTRPPPAPAPAESPSRPRPSLTPTLSLAYLGESLSSTAPWQSGAQAALHLAIGPRLRLALAYGFLAPATFDEPQPLSIAEHDVSLFVGVGGAPRWWIDLAAYVGGGLGLARWRADAAGRSGVRALAKIVALGLARVRFTRALGLSLELGVGVVVVPNRFDFVLCPPGQETCAIADATIAVSPWLIRPRAFAGLAYTF